MIIIDIYKEVKTSPCTLNATSHHCLNQGHFNIRTTSKNMKTTNGMQRSPLTWEHRFEPIYLQYSALHISMYLYRAASCTEGESICIVTGAIIHQRNLQDFPIYHFFKRSNAMKAKNMFHKMHLHHHSETPSTSQSRNIVTFIFM
jgi:hypothetical protein